MGSDTGTAQLLVVAESGDVETFPIRRAGSRTALRFTVGEPHRRGTIWRLWANRGSDDVYLGSRNTAGEVKVSLHQSGDWRLQMVAPESPKTVHFHNAQGSRNGRILDRWNRPTPNTVGWTHALSIVLPEHHLVTVRDDDVRWYDVRWYPAPLPDEQVEFEIHIVAPQQGIVSYNKLLKNGGRISVIDALQLASGDVALVLALTVTTTREEAGYIARCETLARLGSPLVTEFDHSPQLAPRTLVLGVDPSGGRRYYDLSFIAEPV